MKTGKIAEYTKKRKTFVERDKGRCGKKRSDKKEKKFRKHIKMHKYHMKNQSNTIKTSNYYCIFEKMDV